MRFLSRPNPPPSSIFRTLARRAPVVVASWLLAGAGVMIFGMLNACRPASPAGGAPAPRVAAAWGQTSESCRPCHAEIHAAWRGTDHQLANRVISPEYDEAAFTPARRVEDGGSRFELGWESSRPRMTEALPDGSQVERHPEFVLGNKPSRQMLVPAAGGRWQPTDLAWDPARKDWFNVFGQEGRRHGEWGHWTGRGMNWNSMCAHCHMTGYQKNYDAPADRYASSWVEHGVGCIQCHGAMPADHNRTKETGYKPPPDAWTHDRVRAMQTCAPCHARNEQLTLDFQPGDSYHDHYRVTLPVDPAVYYPDGQQRDEDFNWTSVLLSRMGHAGVTCMDCHDPHTTKTILPVENNALCMQCHAAPGRVAPATGIAAPVIEPTAHSHHAENSTGNRCVECHMPTTNYMVRSPRHDHGWLKPDPLLTKELGIPNACNRCHADKSVDWAIQAADTWYGSKLESRQRVRARAVAAAQAGDADAAGRLLELLRTEDIPAWRATMLDLMAPYAGGNTAVVAAARAALGETDPLVRAAGARLLGQRPEAREWLRPLLNDPVRLVRLDAAWTLADELPADSAIAREFDAYLAVSADQPSGQARLGQHLANLGRLAEAEAAVRKAAAWDPFSSQILDTLALVQQAAGRPGEAAASFYRAGQLNPQDPRPMVHSGLAYAEAGRMAEAETALREAVRRDPAQHRAWYNLGLLLMQTGKPQDAIAAVSAAEKSGPAVADYPYALATMYYQTGDKAAAQRAAERAIALDPNRADARALLEALKRGG
ncbi:MAG TPA: tetratricopeptide repeat protein [Opitutaceae bacterium]